MATPISTSVPSYIQDLVPYIPGKPIEETKREFGLKRVIKLASNENPLGPSPKALQMMKKGVRELHRYPDSAAFHLKAALSKHLGIATHQLILGNGSNDVIDILVRSFCVPGDEIVTSQYAFLAYRICAQIQGVSTREVSCGADLKADLSAMVKQVRDSEKVKLVFLANPNNPTGTYNTASELRSFLKEIAQIRNGSVLVVLDYAYWEYVTAKDLPDALDFLEEYANVIVLRTFSKVYGLAGLRVGYGIARPELIATLEKVRQPFNLNSLALLAAAAALSDKTYVKRARKMNSDGMKLWEKSLKQLGIPYWKSQGNFLLVDVMKGLGKRGADVYLSCLKRGVIFRPVTNYGLIDALRISIGTPAENKIAIRALAAERPVQPKLKSLSKKSAKKSANKARNS